MFETVFMSTCVLRFNEHFSESFCYCILRIMQVLQNRYFSLSVFIPFHKRNVMNFCCSINVSKTTPKKDVALLTYHIIGKTLFKNFIADAQKITNFLRLIFTCFLTVAKSIFVITVQINFSRMSNQQTEFY